MRKPTEYPGYSVTRDGEVYSDRRNKKLVKAKISGYHYVSIAVEKGKSMSKTVHRLVAKAFLKNPENLRTVNHKDGDGLNNHVDNLEWASYKDQMKHAHANNLITLTKRSVCQYTLDYEYIDTFASIKEAGEATGADSRLIGANCAGTTFSSGGFRWKYEDDPEDFVKPKGAVHPVEQIDPETDEVIAVFDSIKEASSVTGASSTHIGSVCRGKRKKCGGYAWRFVVQAVKVKEVPIYKDWKPITNYPNYHVSPKGQIWSVRAKKMMKLEPFKDGYRYIKIEGKNKSIHRLVAGLYIPNPESHPVVNHKDGNKSNNDVKNLEWVTRRENSLHAHKTGLVKSRAKKVKQFTSSGKLLKIHNSVKDAAEEVNLTKESIYAACSNRVKLCAGYKFEYA